SAQGGSTGESHGGDRRTDAAAADGEPSRNRRGGGASRSRAGDRSRGGPSMNTELMPRPPPRRQTARRVAPPWHPAVVTIRRATAADGEALHAVIDSHVEQCRVLPR